MVRRLCVDANVYRYAGRIEEIEKAGQVDG
jgi:hypothetical protein